MLFAILAISFPVQARTFQLDSLTALQVVKYLSNADYDSALSLSDSLIVLDQSSPQGWFLRATTLNSRTIDFEDDLDLKELEIAIDSVVTICSRNLDGSRESAPLYFYSGSATGFKSLEAYRCGISIEAVREGIHGGKLLEQAMEADSSYWETYLGLGSYYYYRSAKAGILRSVGLIADKRSSGMEMIKIAMEKATFCGQPAKSALAWIAIEEGDYILAQKLASELLQMHPDKRSFLWCLGRAQKSLEDCEGAAVTYRKLLASIRSEARNNGFNELGCLHSLAQCMVKLDRWEEAVQFCTEGLSLKLTDQVRKRKGKDLSNLESILKIGKAQIVDQLK